MRRYLLQSLPGRAIVIGVVLRIVVALGAALLGYVPQFLTIVDTVAGLGIAIGVGYFVFRLIVFAKRHLLWRVRRKLILSYVFVGFVPALLIVGFFLLCGYLVFYNISSYLVQTQLRGLADRAHLLAQTSALEIQRGGGRDVAGIVSRRQARDAAQFTDLSIAVVPATQTCEHAAPSSIRLDADDFRNGKAGAWKHIDVPTGAPNWISCGGFSGLFAYSHKRAPGSSDADTDTHLFIRAVAFPEAARPGFAVIVDVLVNEQARLQLQHATGIETTSITPVPRPDEQPPAVGRDGGDEAGQPVAAPTGWLGSFPPAVLEYRDWPTGKTGTVNVRMVPNIAELYRRISSTQGSLGTGLLYFLLLIGALFVIIEVLAAIAGFALAKSITGSVHELFMGTERVRQGDFTHKIAIHSEDQLGELASSFNQMTASIEDLLIQAAEKKRMEEELRIAHEIQMSLLPQGPLVMAGLSVTAVCVPAREVGGDYYDFLPLDDHRVGVLIADVSGKGTSAALYMAELKGLILSLSRIHASPRDLLIDANRIIAEHLDARSFITMTYAIVDLRARTMIYARAGHTPLIHVPGPGVESRRARILAPDGLVLGLKIDNGEMFERLLVEDTIRLHEGDLYLFFTDGISEAMNDRDDCFGEGRLGQLVETHANLRSDELRERILRDIAAFVGDAPQHDDMTMILLKVEEQKESQKPEVSGQTIERVVPA